MQQQPLQQQQQQHMQQQQQQQPPQQLRPLSAASAHNNNDDDDDVVMGPAVTPLKTFNQRPDPMGEPLLEDVEPPFETSPPAGETKKGHGFSKTRFEPHTIEISCLLFELRKDTFCLCAPRSLRAATLRQSKVGVSKQILSIVIRNFSKQIKAVEF